jgi:hypothetical protein
VSRDSPVLVEQAVSWEEMPEAMERLRNRDVAGKIALTLGE